MYHSTYFTSDVYRTYIANLLRLATPSAGFITVLSACLRCLSGTLTAALAFADSANGPSYAQRSRREQEITKVTAEGILCANGG